MKRLDRLYMGTNTKMYKTIADTAGFLSRLDQLTEDIPGDRLELFVIPSYTALDAAVRTVAGGRIRVGAQNMGWEDEGQFTGEISPLMLREIGVDLVMAGHSERRHVLGETDRDEEKKVAKALSSGFTALLCVGETAEEKAYGISDEVLRTQLKIGLHSVGEEQAKNLWIAYEPVWAIGVNGVPADEHYANERHRVIKDTLAQLFGRETGLDIPVLYGGSVNPENAPALIQMPWVDGLFIGRSAWDADRFNSIIRTVFPLFYSRKPGQEVL
ncbi:MAG: triose-phosphate isomerase [Enterocloster asparagiformis]|nr:triose-phosphate isomerase [Enterocloster asparagiformis]